MWTGSAGDGRALQELFHSKLDGHRETALYHAVSEPLTPQPLQ